MNVLVACEFSGAVRDAFRALGHEAISCDLEESETPGPHFQGDVCEVLAMGLNWDLMIAFPPCTHLACSGAKHFKYKEREQDQAVEFVRTLFSAKIPRIALENPVGVLSSLWMPPSQIVQPWHFGHGETKSTCLWLKNLPKLRPTAVVNGRKARTHMMPGGANQAKERSRTFRGIAEAMAEQWGGLV